ncbi:DUF6890 family protein [Psychromonas ossibalaenae]|uniref:DUF6890 family protein n=1 Tax=Psychromonas ossibalaenae TaxID=444922 RepID=UPI000369A3AE|nr:hypothetical protein [Psychromonas ossibalaenae]
MGRIDKNPYEQALTLRRHLLPGEDDQPQNLARAMWLDTHLYKRQEIAVANAIGKLFKK